MKLPEKVATIVVGNPLIADVAVQSGGLVVVTGKGYGTTNLIVLDRAGSVLMERSIVVRGASQNTIAVFRGVERETYSCTPNCERRITLGDSAAYFPRPPARPMSATPSRAAPEPRAEHSARRPRAALRKPTMLRSAPCAWLAKRERRRRSCLQSMQQFDNVILLRINPFRHIA